MKKFSFSLAGLPALFFFAIQIVSAAESARRPTIVLISGEYEYKSAETLPVFKQYLETNYGFNCVYLERAKGEDIPGLDALAKADLVILFVRRMTAGSGTTSSQANRSLACAQPVTHSKIGKSSTTRCWEATTTTTRVTNWSSRSELVPKPRNIPS